MAANIGLIFKIWLDELRSLAKGLVCLRQMSKIRQELWIEKAIICVSQTMLYMLKPICLLLVWHKQRLPTQFVIVPKNKRQRVQTHALPFLG